jgi:hypothetical protein
MQWSLDSRAAIVRVLPHLAPNHTVDRRVFQGAGACRLSLLELPRPRLLLLPRHVADLTSEQAQAGT